MKKPKSISKLKKELDKRVKNFVKERDDYTCQKCGKMLEKSNCHGSHVIPVSAGNQFRFDPLNIKVLCFHDHLNWWHKHPIEAGEWFKETFPDRYEYLYGKPRKSVKFSRSDYAEMLEKYKEYK